MDLRYQKHQKGFTLVEIIVVLGIIIGLSTVVFGYIQSAQQSTQAAGMYRDIDFLRTAVLSWRQSNGGDFTGLSTQELADA
ncbi:MAG: prepilin-type N-terminal cleavage/methylation domain-containing protein, partial [Gammaproteobacteria bacterium]